MLTLSFDDAQATDTKLVGGKAHGMATMTRAGIPVSPGFTVSTVAYRYYLASTGLRPRLESLLGLSKGYLSKLRAGDRDPSPELVSDLALIAHDPDGRIQELERFWGRPQARRRSAR